MRVKSILLLAGLAVAVALEAKSSSKLQGLRMTGGASNRLPHLSSSLIANSNEADQLQGGDATIAGSTFNLAKSIIGAGVLSLPSGVAFFSDEASALVPSSVICAVFGLVAAYSFSLIGKICKERNSKSFQDVWSKTVDPKSAWMISGSITAMCFLASLAYSIIIGDSFTSLFQTFNLPPIVSSRPNVIVLLSALVLLPLCSLKSLSSLSPFSILGLGGLLYTAVFMGIRFFDKSYFPGGEFFKDIVLKPSFNQRGGYALNHLTFVLLSMFSTAYVAHYNAPKFYAELKDANMARFNTVVGGAFGAAILFFTFVMAIGYLTFGGNTLGFVLNNYSGKDKLATFARFALGLAMLTGYPFTFSALREGLLDLRGLQGPARDAAVTSTTLSMLGLVTGLALVLKDVGFVVSITGALFGCTLMFVVPAIMNIAHLKDVANRAGRSLSRRDSLETTFNYGMIASGLALAAVGVAITTLRQMGKM